MDRWKARLSLNSLDDRIVPDATPIVTYADGHTSGAVIATYDSGSEIITYADGHTSGAVVASYDNGSDDNPRGDDTTIRVDFTPTEPAPPTDTPPVPSDTLTEPPTPQPGPFVPTPPTPLPGTEARALTDAERAEVDSLVKSINDATTKIVGITALKAGFAADQIKQAVTLKTIEGRLKTANDNLDGHLRYQLALEDRGYAKDSQVYVDAVVQVALDRGVIIGINMGIAAAKKPVDYLQHRMDACDKGITDFKSQINAMTLRLGEITLATKNGKPSGTPPVFAPVSFITPDADWAKTDWPSPTPTPVP